MSRIVTLGLRQQTEYALKQYLSQYKIHLAMQKPPNRRYYGTDGCTLKKIIFRQLPEVSLDAKRGLRNCQAIEANYRGRYTRATIYQRQPDGQWQAIIEYEHGKGTVHRLPKHRPRPVIRMRVVHNALEGSISFIHQQAA